MSMRLRSLQRPFSVSLEVTSSCDLDCVFCSARLGEYRRQDLPTNDLLELVARLAGNGIFSIFLTGGEPLKRQDLPQIIRQCINHQMNVTLSTNGLHADRTTARAIAAVGLEEIQVSIHGTDGIHDKLVVFPGAFDRAMDGLKNLVEAGLRVSVAVVGMKSNAKFLPDLARQTASAGARYFRLLRLMPHSPNMLTEVIPASEMISVCEALMRVQEETDNFTVRLHTSPDLPDERFWSAREHRLVHPLCHTCTAGKLAMGILSNGDCVPCLEMKAPQFMCGNVLQDSLSDIWNAPAMRELRNVSPEGYQGECGKCNAKWTCYSARCTAFHLTGDILGDDLTCYRLAGLVNVLT